MRCLFAVLLLMVALPAHAGPRLDDPVTPTAQRVRLLIDPTEDSYTGRVEIDLAVAEKIESFRLHGEELEIRDATLTRRRKVWPVQVEPADAGTLKVTTPRRIRPGEYTLSLSFENDVHTQPFGLYRFERGEDRFVITQFQADDARTAFPCFDEPSVKIPYQVTLEVPELLVAVSNMPVASEEVDGGWKVLSFEPTPPTPSYLLAVAVGPYASVPMGELGQVYTVPGEQEYTEFLVDETLRTLPWMEDWFGTPMPYPKLDWVVVPQYAFGAMENPGMIVAASQMVLLDPDAATPSQTVRASTVVGHELAHMWFGDLVTMAWWDDLWLNESFADWLAREALVDLWPDAGVEAENVVMAWSMLQEEGRAATQPLRTEVDPDSVFETLNPIWYDKGQGVLTTVQAWLGPDVFQQGVRAYLEAHTWGNATAADLFAALSAASGQDVGAMLQPYLDQPGAPLVRIEVEGTTARVSQERYTAYGAELEPRLWTVPMRWKVGRPDGSVDTVEAVLTGAEGEVEVGDAAWVMPHAGGVGYFVWSQPTPALAALVAAAPEHLTPLERVALIGDLRRLMDAGDLLAGDALALLEPLAGETSPVVVWRLLALSRLVDDVAPEDQQEAVAAWTRDTYRPALDAIGFEPVEGESQAAARLRPGLLYALGHLGQDPDVLAFAGEAAAAFLEDPGAVDRGVAAPALRLAAEEADAAFQDRLLDAWREATDPQLKALYLGAAARVPGEDPRADVLALVLAPESDVSTMFTIIFNAFEEESDKDAGLAWAMENHPALWEKTPPYHRPYLVWWGSGCSEERFARAAAFYGAPERAVPGTEQRIAEFGGEVASCVTRREVHGASVAAFLAEREEAAAEGDGVEEP